MIEREYPGGTTLTEREPGFDAVRSRYGPAMVQRMKNWPKLAENHCLAAGGDDLMVEADMAEARKHISRAARDKDYALAQADAIARNVERNDWEVVPSVSQLRHDWGLE